MPDLVKIGKLLFQLGDYAVKAVTHYANSEEGEKEWGDVVAAFVDLDLFNPADIAQGVNVTRNSESGGLTLEDIDRMAANFQASEEQAGEAPAAPRRTIRPANTPDKASGNMDDIPF